MKRKFLEAIVHERWDHLRPPKFLTQPKAEFSYTPMDVLANTNTDAADRRLIDVDAKICHWLRGYCTAQELIRVADPVRVRKQIAHA